MRKTGCQSPGIVRTELVRAQPQLEYERYRGPGVESHIPSHRGMVRCLGQLWLMILSLRYIVAWFKHEALF